MTTEAASIQSQARAIKPIECYYYNCIGRQVVNPNTQKVVSESQKLFLFNGIYAVVAINKAAAKSRLVGKLKPGHEWYLKEDAENVTEQGHLVIQEFLLKDEVAIISKK